MTGRTACAHWKNSAVADTVTGDVSGQMCRTAAVLGEQGAGPPSAATLCLLLLRLRLQKLLIWA